MPISFEDKKAVDSLFIRVEELAKRQKTTNKKLIALYRAVYGRKDNEAKIRLILGLPAKS